MKAKNYLTESNIRNNRSLYTYVLKSYPDAKKETYIYDYKRQLSKIINGNKNWSDGSKSSHFYTVAKYLRLKNPNDRYHKTYSQMGYDLKLKIDDETGKNELDEKELLFYKDHSYFENILSNIDYDKIQTKKAHMEYLLLNLLTFQPPLRTDFYVTCKIIRRKDDNNKKDNFIHLNRQGKLKCSIIINSDKASNYRIYSMNKNLSSIDIIDDNLAKLINLSYDKYPRTYLFENENNKPISQMTIRSYLRNITGVTGLTFNIMRSSFVNWFYEHHKDFTSRTKLSFLMRHSYMTALKNYRKVDLSVSENNKSSEIDKLNKKIVELNNEIIELKRKLSIYEDDPKAKSKLNKKRYDVIYNANKKNIDIKEDTLKKYNIKLGEDGKYS